MAEIEPLNICEMEEIKLRGDEDKADPSNVPSLNSCETAKRENSRNNNEPDSKVLSNDNCRFQDMSKARKNRIIGTVVMGGIILLSGIVVLGVKLRNANQRQDRMESPMAIPKHIVNTVNRILGNMNETKKPCDDFWLHSCGGYIESHPIKVGPDYGGEMSVKAEMQDSTDEEVIRLLEETTTESTIEPVKMVRKFYRSCTDKVTIEKTMKSFMYGLSEKLGRVPIITGNNYSSDHATTLRTLISVTGELPWLQYYILDDPKSNHTIIRLRLKMNCNEYILLRTITTIRLMFRAPDRVDKILNFCSQTSQMQVLPMDDNFFNGKIYRESDITQHLPSLELVSLFKYIVNTSSKPASSFLFIIDDMSVFKRFDHLVLETDTTDFINIAFLQILQEFYGMIPTIGMYLADSISNLGVARNYIQSNSNLSSIPIKKKTCLDLAYLASDVLGWLYSKKYFDKQVQEQAKHIAKYLEKSMEKVLSERKWLTQESRESAKNIIKKLSKKVHVGSQHSQQAEAKLIKRYENLKLSDNFLENTFALKKRRTQLIISDMLKNDMNQVSDMDIQAVYYVVNNSIHIPIAMLQPPVFYKGAPMALNFAGLGTLIGHEILHAFEADFESSYFNKKWLSDKSYENYDELKEAVVKIYSGYRIESMNFTVNGERTAEENIADIGALKIAYEAYLLWKSDHPDAKKTLPILEMTDLQLFFMSFAQSWCSKLSPKDKKFFENAVHSPMEARVQVPLMNSKDFAEAFNCKKASNMNPYVKSEMWAK